MTRIAVTGAGGFVGRHVMEGLGSQARPVTRATHGDLADAEPSWFRDVEAVIHTAGRNPVRRARGGSVGDDVLATGAVARAAAKAGVASFVLLSSASVYGTHRIGALGEDISLQPKGPYGRAMVLREAEVEEYSDAYDLAVGRAFNIFGPGSTSVVDLWLGCRRTDVVPVLTGSSTAVRDYVVVHEVARGLIFLVGRMGRFNLATGRGRTLADLASMIGLSIPVDQGTMIDSSVADTRKSQRLGLTLEDCLERYIVEGLPRSNPRVGMDATAISSGRQ